MNKNRFLVTAFILLLVLGGLWAFGSNILPKFMPATRQAAGKAIYYCPMHPNYTSDRPGDCPICNMKLVKKEAEPAIPEHQHEPAVSTQAGTVSPKEFTVDQLLNMKPGQICLLHKCKMGNCMMALTPDLIRLGKCPHCGEDLGVIVKDLLPSGYGNIKISPEKQQLIGVKTALVGKTQVEKTIRTVGRIAYDPELYQAEEEYVQAIGALRKAETGTLSEVKEQASRLVDSARLRLKLLGLGPDLVQELEQAGKPDRTLLYGEAGGTVWLYAPIYEYEIPLVKIGDKLNVEVAAVSGKQFEAVIRSIDPVIDPVTRTVRVRAILQNPEGLLKPEMYVNTTLKVNLGVVLSVPQEAVFATGDKNIVFVQKSEGFFEPRQVTLGTKTEHAYEVKSGLAEGEQVVISGNFLIDSESRLKSALESAAGGGHQHGA